jgi:hypothetical protein
MELCTDIDNYKSRIDHQKMISIAPFLFDEMNKII